MRVAADESAVRYSRHTLILAILELCCSLRLKLYLGKIDGQRRRCRDYNATHQKPLKWNTLKTAAYPSIDLITQT